MAETHVTGEKARIRKAPSGGMAQTAGCGAVLSAGDERSVLGKSLVLIRIESWRLCSEEISGKRWSWLKENRHNVAIEICQLNQNERLQL